MTGIEMLRNLAQHCRDASVNGYTTVVTAVHAVAIEATADQIERERACDADTIENVRLIVGRVITDMERHVLGHEGMEDSPVARWARELRAALGGKGRDPADEASMSAYDLLPQEDREAIAWVRERGGLVAVKDGWTGHVPLENVKKMVELHKSKRERLKAHALWLERKCAERRERIEELSGKVAEQSNEIQVLRDAFFETCARLGITCSGSVVDDAQCAWREIARRLMPEGMEWPRFEDGELVDFGDDVAIDDDGARGVDKVVFYGDQWRLFDRYGCEINEDMMGPGERVKRPAPRVGDTVWHVETGEQCKVVEVDSRSVSVDFRADGGGTKHTGSVLPVNLTHRAPVPAADGKPLCEGETVWLTDESERHVVLSTEKDAIGNIVTEVQAPGMVKVHISPSRLTHERPVSDTWERLEEDARKSPCGYFCQSHGCGSCPHCQNS